MNKFDSIVSKIGLDKIVHAFACALITILVSLLVYGFSGENAWVCAFIGGFSAFLVGIVKELVDFFSNKAFDTKDLLADFAGSAFGFVVVGLILMVL